MGCSKKSLLSLVSQETILKLDQRKINEAFVTCVENIDGFSDKETIALVGAMPEPTQQAFADEGCLIAEHSGLGDFWWHNLMLSRDQSHLYIIDTEPLYGEFRVEEFPCASPYSLTACAKRSLKEFNLSSEIN